MASTEGLVPITRNFLASFYDKYPFEPLSADVYRLSSQIRSMASDLLSDSPLSQVEALLVKEADCPPPHKIDENMWKNREQIEEVLFLIERSHWPPLLQRQSTPEDTELALVVGHLKDKFHNTMKILQAFQSKNSEHIFNTVMTYMPQDFRGSLIRQQRERSERNKQAEVDALVNSGGSIRDRYALLWNQQMERRRQLAQLGSATGVYKTLVKYLVGVPQVLLDFIQQLNDDQGPMEEQRQRYGPPLYSLTTLSFSIRLFLFLSWRRFDTRKLTKQQIAVLEQAVNIYTSEFERFIKFISEVFANSPFFISAEDAGAIEARKTDEYKEIVIPAGKTHEVSLIVESINSYIAWDFSLAQGKMNMGLVEQVAMAAVKLFFLLVFSAEMHGIFCFTNSDDAVVLHSLKDQWEKAPPSWAKSDPCGAPWDGVTCNNSRVIALGLSTMGLKGKLVGDIGGLTELRSLDLSFNPDLVGSLTPRLGDLKNLNILILAGCSFSGQIPDELGNLEQLTFLALNSNNLTGHIPPSLGALSNLYWLDLADNKLTGPIPTNPGLNQLLKAKHFHFNKNQLSGPIPQELFSSDMVLIHILFDGNQLSGTIPDTLGHVQTLEVLRLDRNLFNGTVPSNLNNLTGINELNLAFNQLTGPMPNLTGMDQLSYVDLSDNNFDPSEAPAWFSTLPALTTLVVENGSLYGSVPTKVFSFPEIEQVKLKNNAFNDTFSMGDSIGSQLQLVDLQNNQIPSVTLSSGYTNSLILVGNPVCDVTLSNTAYCQIQDQTPKTYSTNLANCGGKLCSPDQKLNPQSCECAYPYEGTLYFRFPAFRELSDFNVFHSLESSLWNKLNLTPGSVFLENPFFNIDDYLQIQLALFPPTGKYFSRSEVVRIGFSLSNQTYKPPEEFGPYYFIASPYHFQGQGGTSFSLGVIIGIAIGCTILVLGLVALAVYAIRQKKRAERAIELSRPFASWAPSGKDSGGAPQLKGARWFTYDELKKCTNNFSESNEIGSGGYGKVYRGMLAGGQIVAIKRAQQGSMQGGLEFKTEIELLSRVHHKNLVGLVGFCYEQGEQMLVYEFLPNGTLRESLSGRSGIHLDWKRRLRIALGSARGLAYLHELANPPIIHRDVKSTNILLDENLSAKVADFGLSKLVSDSEKGHVSTQVKGTLGYLDPEYYMTQQLTEKSDVYSFGVVMLELISARQPIEKGKYIVREVRIAMNRNDEEYYGLREIMDPTIRNATNLIGFGKFLELAMQCVEESAADRPTMSDVVKTIETILQNDGMNTNSTSASSSATEFGASKGAPKHPYNDSFPRKEVSDSDAFNYSGGYTLSTKIEPK